MEAVTDEAVLGHIFSKGAPVSHAWTAIEE